MTDVSAKDEIGEYATATRFGGRKKIRRDKKIPRPVNINETIIQIERCYGEQKWNDAEQRQNHASCGLGAAALTDLTDDELEIVRADMERRRMILYEN